MQLDDGRSEAHSSRHLVLVARYGERVVAGLKAYIGDLELGEGIPMEHDGVEAAEYQRTHFAGENRGHVARVSPDLGSLRPYRRDRWSSRCSPWMANLFSFK